MIGSNNWCKGRPAGDWEENLSRLAAPRPVNPNFIPDKPSVYWLDYLLDPTPHKIKDSSQLDLYYRKFETPRLQRLSQPKLTQSAVNPFEARKPLSNTGIPLSALHYVPSPRIKQLAEPRLTHNQSDVNIRVTRSCCSQWPGKTGRSRGNSHRFTKARSRV